VLGPFWKGLGFAAWLAALGAPALAQTAKKPAAAAPPAQIQAQPNPAPAPSVGAETGLKLPRFASLASDSVNVRAGPGQRYPVSWQYQRRGLPIEVLAEYELWRKIRDRDGGEGWVHKSLLSGRRTALIQGGVVEVLYQPSPESTVRARAEPGVQVRLLSCDAAWCRIELAGNRGFVPRGNLWGVYPGEKIE
jgi:SH3-like domain-containing protein